MFQSQHGRRAIRSAWTAAIVGSTLVAGFAPTVSAQLLTTIRVASPLSAPLFVNAPAGDDRLFILEQNNARIMIVENGQLLGTPFLDVNALASSGGERGLLGMAFHPDYANTGFFFINYTDNAGNTVVARYSVTADRNIANPNSAQIILSVVQPFSNHNGGMLAFGPDGYLYIFMGDGGSANDPGNRAQNGLELLGKILRLDIDHGLPYTIPADNPFITDPNVRDEIWALGMRNPWRSTFDRLTGDLWIADVGQNVWEEVNFEAASDPGGNNYGWRCMEGLHCTGLTGCTCNGSTLTLPFHEYQHLSGRCSVTGGYVYRGPSIPLLQGTYFFGDYCSADLWSLRYDGSQVTEFTDRRAELAPGGGLSISQITSFGEDGEGEMYIVDGGGEVFQIVTKLRISTNVLTGGQQAVVQIVGATPNQRVYIAYSLAGTGSTNIPPLGVIAALDNPVLVGSILADGSGNATFRQFVPGAASGQEVWVQAAEFGNTSNVVNAVVQ